MSDADTDVDADVEKLEKETLKNILERYIGTLVRTKFCFRNVSGQRRFENVELGKIHKIIYFWFENLPKFGHTDSDSDFRFFIKNRNYIKKEKITR